MAAILDAIDEALFCGRTLLEADVRATAYWLGARQIRSGKWTGMFAPTNHDYGHSVTLFTREKLHTRLATRNILTAQAARALTLFGRQALAFRTPGNVWIARTAG